MIHLVVVYRSSVFGIFIQVPFLVHALEFIVRVFKIVKIFDLITPGVVFICHRIRVSALIVFTSIKRFLGEENLV